MERVRLATTTHASGLRDISGGVTLPRHDRANRQLSGHIGVFASYGIDRPRSFRDDTQESIRGSQHTAIRFTQRLHDAGIQPSMGSVGDSFDNALAENFFSILKVELVYRTSFRTREEADLALFGYIDGWYNPHRIQRGLSWRSPDEFEAAYHTTLAPQPASFTIQSGHRAPGSPPSGKPGNLNNCPTVQLYRVHARGKTELYWHSIACRVVSSSCRLAVAASGGHVQMLPFILL